MNYHGSDQWSAILDQLTPSDLLAILVDEARLTVSPDGLKGSFAGAYYLYTDTGDERICRASDDPIVLRTRAMRKVASSMNLRYH